MTIETLFEDISQCTEWLTPEEILATYPEVIVFGTGQAGLSLNEVLTDFNVNILYFVDNDESKHGLDFLGKEVKSPTALAGETRPILIASYWARDIAEQLQDIGSQYFDFSFCVDFNRWKNHFNWQCFNINAAIKTGERYLKGNDLLSYLGCLRYRQTYDPLYLTIPNCEHYIHTLVTPMSSDVYIDGGAWQGDTLHELKQLLGNEIEIHSFEPDESNFKQLSNLITNQKLPNCYIHKKALWNQETTLNFFNSSNAVHTMQARVSTELNPNIMTKVQVAAITLDSYCQTLERTPTYIKLDVEGAEPQVLEGATILINTSAPKLAISAYHEPNHIWELMEQIALLNTNYQFFFVHHSQQLFESVIYSKVDA
ncbi:FkbM family methyltransferase [Shewanella sp. VB17]|uniref:FkbM family methyltransferase n=1 Tax=Shewanella sp. VB17 TaxID=2739432 RepID=UPI00156574F7|nr:FkbM family methyltransferase [Shewanella sp. VB17]NRD74818.1 FkbM family methyltransferase [Shewanella sp. VB17]